MRRGKHFKVEGLERRVLLSSAIAAFGAQQTFATGSSPSCVATADVNGDGKLDLIVANAGTSNSNPGIVSVLLGNGNGTFQSQATFATGSRPISVVTSDVNGDGHPDLIVANFYNGTGGNSVSVLLGNGNGTFQAQATFATGSEPTSVAVADVNGDGKADLIVANSYYGSGGHTVSVLLGNGNGTFQSQATFATGTHPTSVATADVNADGKPDLIVANNTGVSVLLGNGNGTFQSQSTFAAGTFPVSVTTSDVNQDGKPDLIVANDTTPGTVSVLLGNGDGTFQTQATFATGAYPLSVAASDVNRDGRPDLIVANEFSNTVSVLLGNGNGTFKSQATFAVGRLPFSVTTADVNGDGRSDLIVANSYPGTGGNSVSVLLGDVPPTVLSINRTNPPGPITSDSSVTYTVTFNEAVTGVDPTDFALATTGGVNATTPVVVTPVNGSVYSVTINGITGTGTLGLNLVDDGSIKDAAGNPLQPGGVAAFQMQNSSYAGGSLPQSLTTADLNRDGRTDLVLAYRQTNNVGVLLGNGDGTFQWPLTFAAGSYPLSAAVADVNGDGKLDLVTVNYKSNTISVLLGHGDGTFQPQRTFATGVLPGAVVLADFNGDGKTDLAVENGDNTISVLLGRGDGSFLPQQTIATVPNGWLSGIAAADLNNDGHMDLVVSNFNILGSSNLIGVLLGNGNGTFRSVQTFLAGNSLKSFAIADVNGDGRPDLAVVNYFSTAVSVLLGNGDGTFQAQRTFPIEGHADSVVVTDVNGDGRADLVVTYVNSFVGVLLGNGDGSFSPQQTFSIDPGGHAVALADLNKDGRPDIVTTNRAFSTISVLLANSNGNFTGQTYTIVPSSDTITGTSGVDQITLVQNPDNQHIDWTLNGTTAEMAISDPNGLTINGNGSSDIITLDYTNNNPLPNTVHLNGTFTINGLQGASPLLNTTLEIGRSTVYISYASPASDPIAAIKQYLRNGYNNGGWNGIPAASPAFPGDITSIPAAQNAAQTTAIGCADSADGLIAGQPANTIELKYTLYGDTTLTGTVGFNDFTRLTQHYNLTTGGTWDTGDFNYDGSVTLADFTLMTRTYNTSLGNQAVPAVSAASASNSSPVHQAVKHHRKHRRRPAIVKEKD